MTRTWSALCFWGAGLVHLASGAGALPHPVAILLLVAGAVEFVWGLVVLRADRLERPTVILAGTVSLIGASALAALTGVMAPLPLAAAALQLLIVAGIAAVALRRQHRDGTDTDGAPEQRSRPSRRTGRTVLGFTLCALLVSGVTTPALAATEAGRFAVPHGSHSHFE